MHRTEEVKNTLFSIWGIYVQFLRVEIAFIAQHRYTENTFDCILKVTTSEGSQKEGNVFKNLLSNLVFFEIVLLFVCVV